MITHHHKRENTGILHWSGWNSIMKNWLMKDITKCIGKVWKVMTRSYLEEIVMLIPIIFRLLEIKGGEITIKCDY